MPELKPCPFCGSEDTQVDFSRSGNHSFVGKNGLVHNTPFFYIVFCADCGARTMDYEEPERAADAWNRRADNG